MFLLHSKASSQLVGGIGNLKMVQELTFMFVVCDSNTFLGQPGDWDNLDILDEEEATDPAESRLLLLPRAD